MYNICRNSKPQKTQQEFVHKVKTCNGESSLGISPSHQIHMRTRLDSLYLQRPPVHVNDYVSELSAPCYKQLHQLCLPTSSLATQFSTNDCKILQGSLQALLKVLDGGLCSF